MNKKVIIIGGGVAGMQTAISLQKMDIASVIVEKKATLGGKLSGWDRLFPTMTPAEEVLIPLKNRCQGKGIEVLTSTKAISIGEEGKNVTLQDGTELKGDAVVVASGFDLFPAEAKEEYGYGIYDNVYTTADIERMFREGSLHTKEGRPPKTIALLHCVGSRDEKVCQRHCSRVCCITGVKQAIEMKQAFPDAEIFSFYMDMRMFGPGYEELYRQAQLEFNIHFIRGRISEASQTIDNRIQIKAEDTLVSLPMRMTVDMLVLIVGMKAGESNSQWAECAGIELSPSGFVKPRNLFTDNVCAHGGNIFYAGTVTAPKNIGESINEGITVAQKIYESFKE